MRYETPRERRAVGEGGAVAAARASSGTTGRAAVDRDQPTSPHRDPVRAADGPAVATPSLGDGMWIGLHVLAPIPHLDQAWGVAPAPSVVVAGTGLGGRDRLEPGRDRQLDDRGEKGGNIIGPNPTDKGRAGSKRHLVVDAAGVPLAIRLTPANVNDCQLFEDMLDAIPTLCVRGRGRPRHRPGKAHADKGYDYAKCRRACRTRGITARIARRGIESKERLGRHRWVVERDFAWLNAMRRLRTRYDRRASQYLGFLHLGCALICWNYLSKL